MVNMLFYIVWVNVFYRCRRVIVIVTPAFLRSDANKFFYSFAQSISIGKFIIGCKVESLWVCYW